MYCVKCRAHTETDKIRKEVTKNKKRILKGICLSCGKTKCCFQKGGDIVSWIQDKFNPPEIHIPGYQFCGPFTKLKKRLQRGDPGINRVDKACKKHDIAYSKTKDTAARHVADQDLLDDLDNIQDPTLGERLSRTIIKPIIKTKKRFGLGHKKR